SPLWLGLFFFFFFQAEDGIRDFHVTGVQTCALPILPWARRIDSVASRHACSSRTSRRTARAGSPSDAATTEAPASSMSVTWTVAPSAANALAIASPIPRAAPVTRATLFSRRMSLFPRQASPPPPRGGDQDRGSEQDQRGLRPLRFEQ